ncbi:ClpXP protease specificity-enhancing factor [Marinobacterium aestuariivivens]|uniref:ClpXP protease specificity-enhancing factor n=1 Tax=Marinobacterium aestuariivivens TaxID=1698799 RepID=A0ABW1ZWM3_9GAMM
MNPSRPYIVRALYEWILDNDCTPHLLVNAEAPGVVVPQQAVQDGQVVLNVMPSAVRNLVMEGDEVTFGARFGGVPMQVRVPYGALLAIYARENGMGMGFGMEPGADLYERLQPVAEPSSDDGSPEPPEPPKGGGRPKLKVVK